MDSKEQIRGFYNSNVMYEWDRLNRHPIEFAVTKHYIDKYIEPGSKVLDIGGGPGRYSIYLARKGCEVTLLDLSEENVKYATAKALEYNLMIKGIQGDACYAENYIKDKYDYILLMGPMYHLLEESERIKCMESALNLLKPEGIIYVSFISLYAGFSYYMKNDPNLIKEDGENEYIKCYLDNKTYCGDAFTKACFITPNEILPFMERFNLKKLHLLGQEGITSMCENNIYACVKEIIDKWIDIAIKTCERKEFYALSEHIMYIGKSN